jgi:hypothetical protein
MSPSVTNHNDIRPTDSLPDVSAYMTTKTIATDQNTAVIGSDYSRLRKVGFGIVNIWLLFHLIAIFLPAFSVPPSPEVIQDLYWSTRFYSQAIYMDHGYHFFGPDPGDSTLLRFVATKQDGTTVRGTYPSRHIFPRLRYHRHFMLTEAIPRISNFDGELGALQANAYAERILKATEAESVRLYRVTHQMTSVDRFLAGGRLDDPETYSDQELGVFSIGDSISVVQR